jgi:hypothetical protein
MIPLVAATGCIHGPAAALGLHLFARAAVVAAQAPSLESVVVAQQPPVLTTVAAPSTVAARSTAEALPKPRPFDSAAARAMLNGADLAACRAQGLPRGYVHLRATFTGGVTRVLVDAPAGLPASVFVCVRHAVAEVPVPPYEGDGEFTLGVSRFVP